MDFILVEDVPAAQAVVLFPQSQEQASQAQASPSPASPNQASPTDAPPADEPPTQLNRLLARLQKIKAPPVESRPDNRRFGNRKPLGLQGRIEYNGVLWADCIVLDMSAGGAQIEIRHDPRRGPARDFLPEVFDLIIENLLERSVARCQVRWQRGYRYGVLFLGPIDATIKRLPKRSPIRGAADEKKSKPGSR